MTFLIVDDAKVSRTYIRNLVHELKPNSTFIEAENGKDAIEKLGTNIQIDCIFLDIHMPEVDGMQFLKVAKGHEKFKGIPVVILTTDTDASKVKEAITLGAMDYLGKPPDRDKVKNIIDKL